MALLSPSHIASVAILVFLAFYVSKPSKANPRKFPLPPSPKPDPIVGHALQIPIAESWLKFLEWKKQLGNIIYLNAMGQHIIILNSYEVAHELLGRRAIYSDRPKLQMASELSGNSNAYFNLAYNDRWKRYRKLSHSVMHKSAMHKYWTNQADAASDLLRALLESPKDFYSHVRLMPGKAILSTVYGIHIESEEDEYIVMAEEFSALIAKWGLPGSALVNVFPLLGYIPSWFPGANFKRVANHLGQLARRLREQPFQHVKSKITSGVLEPSMTATLINETGGDDEYVSWVSGGMYIAGADTTASALATFMLMMTLHPRIQKKAQEEIDRVVGSNRLPTFKDRENLPYVECIIKEVLRWYPIAPLAVPHRLMEEDYYEGYWMPANSTVIPNVWAMSRDGTIYKDPEAFYPERFEDKAGNDLLDPRSYIFGFGRRTCVGMHFTDDSMYIVFAYILATFDISKLRDDNGVEVEPSVTFNAGLINRVNPWQCDIRPRSAQAVELIRSDHST
ncbi:hypothetical protein BOTBODRAFT_132169 [Botryobasidium botryosum FD-172 SS1]|uniref:Cytochrome P450 n=1 Tax=Botryobasidium botryosum (strain FD-172 SS1) TaxID=930990 RepID=A0A067MT68_BOTB1|nr:hypothetical protein BOTBODRAFT_132169 [Botryobasidium botryosum FD-172 SS1]